jgi:hypothetical protein
LGHVLHHGRVVKERMESVMYEAEIEIDELFTQ